ncbi:MAG: NAD-dependent epimerase/dehydratase family protein [Candidatus Eremiobacteraeota bacterium]|nr:NAD-dependent epimerase/dehydratase family protein [Candidatus Eremiobacteraeota bacterium]
MDLRDARILITGGAGLIGSGIAEQALKEGAAEIVVLDNFVRGRRENLDRAESAGNVRLQDGDIRDPQTVAKVVDGIDIVFHQAAIRITQCAEDPRLAFEVLGGGTFTLLEAAVRAGVIKIVAASSASVYGQADVFPTPECHHPYNDKTIYGACKTFNEGLLRSFHEMYELPYVALRYFNVYGPRMDIYGVYTEVLIRWMQTIEAGKPPMIFGDGKQTMDFIYIDDVVRSNISAAKSSVTQGAFNIASGQETSLEELLTMLLRIMGSSLRPQYAPARTVASIERRLADTTQAKQQLDFEAVVPLEEGLRQLLAWWHQQKSFSHSGRS